MRNGQAYAKLTEFDMHVSLGFCKENAPDHAQAAPKPATISIVDDGKEGEPDAGVKASTGVTIGNATARGGGVMDKVTTGVGTSRKGEPDGVVGRDGGADGVQPGVGVGPGGGGARGLGEVGTGVGGGGVKPPGLHGEASRPPTDPEDGDTAPVLHAPPTFTVPALRANGKKVQAVAPTNRSEPVDTSIEDTPTGEDELEASQPREERSKGVAKPLSELAEDVVNASVTHTQAGEVGVKRGVAGDGATREFEKEDTGLADGGITDGEGTEVDEASVGENRTTADEDGLDSSKGGLTSDNDGMYSTKLGTQTSDNNSQALKSGTRVAGDSTGHTNATGADMTRDVGKYTAEGGGDVVGTEEGGARDRGPANDTAAYTSTDKGSKNTGVGFDRIADWNPANVSDVAADGDEMESKDAAVESKETGDDTKDADEGGDTDDWLGDLKLDTSVTVSRTSLDEQPHTVAVERVMAGTFWIYCMETTLSHQPNTLGLTR